MDKLYAKLSEQHAIPLQQNEAASPDDEAEYTRGLGQQPSSNSLPMTPAVETLSAPTAPTARSASVTPNESQVSSDEILRLKLELAQAQSKISRLDQELAQTRLVSQESGRATPSLFSEPDFPSTVVPPTSPVASRVPSAAALIGLSKTPFVREHNWMAQDDTRSDIGDPLSVGGFNRARGIWNNSKIPFGNHLPQVQAMGDGFQPVPWANSRSINPNYEATFATPCMDMYRQDRMAPEQEVIKPVSRRGNRYDNRFGPSSNFSGGFGGYNMGTSQYELGYAAGPQGVMAGGMGMGLCPPYQQQSVGTTLSPHATEFTSTGTPWKAEVS